MYFSILYLKFSLVVVFSKTVRTRFQVQSSLRCKLLMFPCRSFDCILQSVCLIRAYNMFENKEVLWICRKKETTKPSNSIGLEAPNQFWKSQDFWIKQNKQKMSLRRGNIPIRYCVLSGSAKRKGVMWMDCVEFFEWSLCTQSRCLNLYFKFNVVQSCLIILPFFFSKL